MFRRILVALVLAIAALSAAAADKRPDLVIAVNKLARGLEPAEQTGNVDVRITYSIFDTLIRRDFSVAGGGPKSLKPSLAVSWTRYGPNELEVHLRHGVKFHDGSPFTADDVVFTFSPERLIGGKSAAIPEGRAYFGHLKEVRKIDDYTVRFVTQEPDPVLEQRLATYDGWIVSKAQWMKYKTDDPNWMRNALREIRWHPIGTGPLKFKDWRKDQYMSFVANDDYFLGKPAFKSVTFKEVPELATRIAGIASGEFDIIVDVSPDQIETLKRYKDIDVRSTVLENSHIVVFNMSAPVFKDKRLRQAMSLAIDRKKLRDALWRGQNYTPNGWQLKTFGDLYDAKRPAYAYEPKRARELVKASGYDGRPIGFRVIPNYYLNGLEAAQVMQEMWKAVGVNVRLDLVDNFKQVRGPGMEMHLWSTTFRLPDPAGSISIIMGPTANMQRTWKYFIAPPGFNQAEEIERTAFDPKERLAAFRKMLDIMADEMPVTFLYNPLYSYATKKKLLWRPLPLYYMDFRPDVFRVAR
jgi:peptide/nickel transport system substrate-binding protein